MSINTKLTLKFHCLKQAHDLADMPDEKMINAVQHAMVTKTKAKHYISKSRGEDVEQAGPLYLEVGSSSRSSACCCHSFPVLAERLIGLVECVYKLTKQKRKDGKQNLTILLFCEDGYVSCGTSDVRSLSLTILHSDRDKPVCPYLFDVHPPPQPDRCLSHSTSRGPPIVFRLSI
jgi:hypothetical protein